MCGRNSMLLNQEELHDAMAREFGLGVIGMAANLQQIPMPNYNAAPTHAFPVLVNFHDAPVPLQLSLKGEVSGEEEFVLVKMTWGIPNAQHLNTINARSDKLLSSPLWSRMVKRRHFCVVPVSGYYEWATRQAGKEPYHVVAKEGERGMLFMAGLFERGGGGDHDFYFTIVTREPSPFIKPIHDRMPKLLFGREEVLKFLGADRSWEDRLAMIGRHDVANDERLRKYVVSNAINKVANQSKDLVLPVREYDARHGILKFFSPAKGTTTARKRKRLERVVEEVDEEAETIFEIHSDDGDGEGAA